MVIKMATALIVLGMAGALLIAVKMLGTRAEEAYQEGYDRALIDTQTEMKAKIHGHVENILTQGFELGLRSANSSNRAHLKKLERKLAKELAKS